MSRRIVLVLLAASAALTTSHAYADPECFADSCRLPAVVEPPPAAAEPVPAAATATVVPQVPEPAREALARPAPRPTVYPREAARPPRPARTPLVLSPFAERPQLVADAPAPARDYEAPVVRTAQALPPPVRYSGAVTSRVEQGAIDTGPIVGFPYTAGAVVIGVPGVVYGVWPVYLVAPSAKIIHIERNE